MKHDLPGVGENLQDHIGGRIIHRCVDGTVTMNEIYHNWLRRLYAGAEWILAQKGPLMTGAGPIGLFVKTRPELDSPDVQYQFLAGSAREDRRADAPLSRLHHGGDPLPAGKPRLAAHPVARPDPGAGDAAELPVHPGGPRHHRRRPAGDAADLRHRQHAALLQGRDLSRARRRRPTRICWTTSAPPPARRSTRPAPA